MSEKEAALFFNFNGPLFSDIFDRSKTERAKTIPSVSDKSHEVQDDMIFWAIFQCTGKIYFTTIQFIIM